jgi:gas vesicle protein GvpK
MDSLSIPTSPILSQQVIANTSSIASGGAAALWSGSCITVARHYGSAAGSLTLDEIERIGTTLMKQTEEIKRLQREFGLKDEDLNIDLGPLGTLL